MEQFFRYLHLYLFGPRLLRSYRRTASTDAGGDGGFTTRYKPNLAERIGTKLLSTFRIAFGIGKTLSPVICLFLYRQYRRSVAAQNQNDGDGEGKALAKFTTYYGTFCAGLIIMVLIAFVLRAAGRAFNTGYTTFISTVMKAADVRLTVDQKYALLNKYDFTPYEMPAIFRADDLDAVYKRELGECADGRFGSSHTTRNVLYHAVCYAAIHTFGKRMLYPGSVHVLQYLFMDELTRGRAQLVEKYGGERRRILTADGSCYIDTMFLDRRRSSSTTRTRQTVPERVSDDDDDDDEYADKIESIASIPSGSAAENVKNNFLVICCEGNSGFYELGLQSTPASAVRGGYSVLGWNHPGFMESTGTPFPKQEVLAIDAVMQYATKTLKFSQENIILYAWSIGGFTACWAARLYPNIRTLVLDATFDNVIHLARTRFPPAFAGLLQYAIKNYCYLNMDELLDEYSGPIVLIRRLQDEIIVTGEPGDFRYNRCNNLLLKILQQRFPFVLSDADDFDADTSNSYNLYEKSGKKLLKMFLEANPREKQVLMQQFQLTRDNVRRVADCIRQKRRKLQQNFIDTDKENFSIFPITATDLQLFEGIEPNSPRMKALRKQLLLSLASTYMRDAPLSHCMPLPRKMFDELVPCFDDAVDHDGFFGYQDDGQHHVAAAPAGVIGGGKAI